MARLYARAAHIRARQGSVEFRFAQSTHPSIVAAKLLAREALHSPHGRTLDLAPEVVVGSIPMEDALEQAKVFTTLPELREPKVADSPQLTIDEIVDPEDKHRGRRREREILRDNMNKLLACKTSREFWELLRKWTDDRPLPPGVTPADLHKSFEARLNPPEEIPHHFDAELHKIIEGLAAFGWVPEPNTCSGSAFAKKSPEPETSEH
ncbi:hypothetical protein GGX14DRAFT_403728 [Mycena pura]|uniref:Uncharacterized protein n=1 Tax=Mycena pura TaxID=153505 RepID=A0AAD6Y2A7_9AGAR|nr:hypothetical protein GGX14DRAFT_403728 [Mycena pura]